MAEGEIRGHSFGQRRPPLTELIESILVRYPDGGQILKELIQNADDAGATEVKFLYDNQSFGTDSLFSPELSKFQGPALYCYNDALFEEEDWEGIQNLMRSNKKDDPLKVGRFGIGFNSVYHITDLPGIVSGERVGFLDPHEKYFGPGQSGQRYDIKDGLLRPRFRDQFAPFHNTFGCDLSNTRTYGGTLFRFPLRNMQSKLSKKLYTASMVDNLFGSLREEASVILLFLKSVESIGIYKRRDGGAVDCVFKVEVSQDSREEVRRKRQGLLLQVRQPTRIAESKYVVTIHVTAASQRENFKWLIVNQVGSTERRITELCTKLCLLPWIGLAVPINTRVVTEGRIFCFLPLPPDVDCQTGLPVHIHGYFGLTDNRRGLTWPGAECQNNETAEWNELLLTKIGSVVYCKMLEALVTNEPDVGVSPEQQCQLVYSTLPVLENVRGHWRCILDPLFQKLIYQRLFYAQHISTRSWITLDSGVLDLLQESGTTSETRKAVLKILLQKSQMIITNLPLHVQRIVNKYFSLPRIISPALVRSILKNSDISMTSREDKLRLLGYVLSDEQISDMSGVPLLPLANGRFTTFCPHRHVSNPSVSVFMPSGNCTAALLPNMPGRFLDEGLSRVIKEKFYAIAATKTNTTYSTQLVRLTSQIVFENIRASLPAEWFSCSNDKVSWNPGVSNHPPQKWLEAVWNWITVSFPSSLAHFQGIPLVPVDKHLGVLSQNSKFIFASDSSGNCLPSPISTLLTRCGCTVISEVPIYLHHRDIKTYIAPSTPAGVLTVLSRVSVSTLQVLAMQILASQANRAAFRDFMCRLPGTISASEKNVLLQLSLFDTIHGAYTAAKPKGANLLKAASSEFGLPAGFQLSKDRVIISSTDTSTVKLLHLLNVEILKPADVLIQYLFPDISANSRYNSQEITLIMQWILEWLDIFKSQSQRFLECLKVLPFVPTQSGKRKIPAELYDPNDPILRALLAGEKDVFPTGNFALDNAISKLKLLNLKTRMILTAADLYRFAQIIALSHVSAVSVNRVTALIEILNSNPSYLNQHVNRSALSTQLCKLRWIPCSAHPPQNYPDIMPWYNKAAFFSPSEICTSSKALLIGSSMPTLGINMNVQVQQGFGLTRDPPIHYVLNHLKAVIASWKLREGETISSMKMAKFEAMLTEIYLYLSKFSPQIIFNALHEASIREWIWHGEGFCLARNVALSKDFALDLRPRLFLLQNEFRANSSLTKFFLQHGVRNKFSDEDILGVLHEIRKKHANPVENISIEVEQDLELCRSILQWVVKDGHVLSESLQKKVFVPVQSSRNVLVLEACKKCTYCDRDWLRHGGTELDIPGDYQIIHDSVSENVARLLGVPPLSTCLLSAETLGFEQTGPFESITNRIKTILQEYKEGVGIFKELIQNADDAGATEVRFVVDWRDGPKKKLLSTKMAECQGPALWAYNDAEFSDEDFENINKLAGATKVDALGKIGRFGLGFNAVYHLTDIPSFVSRQYFVVFDPNVNHLQSHIKDKSRPGIRINLAVNPRPLSAFEDQFQPYHNVFSCDTQVTESEFYCNGTLFRFPFRTLTEANESKICQSIYNKEKVMQVVDNLRESTSLLLLYTQHVKQVELYEIENGSDPSKMKLVLSVSKSHLSRTNSSSSTLPFIKECSNWWQKKLGFRNSETAGPTRCELVRTSTKEMTSDLIPNVKQSVKHETWLLTSCVGTDSSVCLAASGEGRQHGLLPCAGAAVRLSCIPKKERSTTLHIEAVEGEAFCFLPLSIPTGFPVHVNGYFAITSNRRGIWERTTSRQSQQIEVQWNESLMEDALSNAYVQLLKEIKGLSESGRLKQYTFHALWPIYDKLHCNIWGSLVKSVYTKLVTESLPLFCSDGKWLAIDDGYILKEDLCQVPEVVNTLQFLAKNVFHVPRQVISSLMRSGQGEAVRRNTLDLKTFLELLFFPNVRTIPQKIRDPIVCYILDRILSDYEKFVPLFNEYPCITCSEDGSHLAKPSMLVNPMGPVANLFFPEDHRFPVGEHFLSQKRIHALEQLGMVKDRMSWREICGRAESVKNVAAMCQDRGRERAWNLIKYLKENMDKLATIENEVLAILRSIEFLPFMFDPPDAYGLPWKGSEFRPEQFFAPNKVFMSSDKYLVGSSSPIVDDSEDSGCGKLGHRVKDLLGFSSRLPRIEQVLQQIDAAIKSRDKGSNGKRVKKDTLESICKRVYKYFNDLVTNGLRRNGVNQRETLSVEWLLEELSHRSWVFIQGQFVSSEKVAYNWSGIGAPYLYGLPYEYRGKYDVLLNKAGVKQFFSEIDFLDALYALKASKGGDPLANEELKLAVCFLSELKDTENLTTHIGQIPLPDSSKLLCQSNELTINTTFWLKDRGDARYVHKDIPPQLALDLGAKSLHHRRLKKYSTTIGSAFGQHEKLTDRLKNILKSYPSDSGILKELVQNADDAGATEIHFIHDTRNLPSERVVQENAQEVQGPALCVYNDRPFHDKDLEGIQKLGIGSKGDDLEKTGQYGIGFNAVYHLTDCPSFLSNEDTLCLLDPHCRYAPEATVDAPGEIFKPIDEDFKEDYKDSLLGYLGKYFVLKDATMFRLPLRTRERSQESLISNQHTSSFFVKSLLSTFKGEAKKMLLFLNHIKKISLSEIDEHGQLMPIYNVAAALEKSNDQQRREISHFMRSYKDQPTRKVPRKEITYPITLSDSNGIVQKWLVHQCCGASCQSENEGIPDGRSFGLFPRGGVAALVSDCRQLQETHQDQPRYLAYCFLPLPVYTSLPVHVNGHFALDSSRRNLWSDTDPDAPLTRWNNFMKSRVLAPGYATLICEARKYIPYSKENPKDRMKWCFANLTDARLGLDWYHKLFPHPSQDSAWNILARAVYHYLGCTKAPILPILVADETQVVTAGAAQAYATAASTLHGSSNNVAQVIRDWLPVQDVYFLTNKAVSDNNNDRLFEVLLRILLPLLLLSPSKIHSSFEKAGVSSKLLNPRSVIDFLRTFKSQNSTCEIGELPSHIEATNIRRLLDLKALIDYCKEEEDFPNLLEDLPLLLTADNQLRVFDSNHPVYRSTFSDLFPAQARLFVHPNIVYKLPEIETVAVPRVMRMLTVNSLAEHLPYVFPPSMKGAVDHIPWTFREKGLVLSKEWFQRLWDFLENHAKPKPDEKQVSLESLGVWPILPTTHGKLVTIDNGTTVLDATQRKTETAQGRFVREVLNKLNCPSLNTDITVKKPINSYAPGVVWGSILSIFGRSSGATSQSADLDDGKVHVTDPCVAHPHSVADVLQILDYMRKSNILDASRMTDQDFHKMLAFFQDDLNSLKPWEKFVEILKALPFYKAIDGCHFSLSLFSFYAVIPNGVPTEEIGKLQCHTKCLFLHPEPTADLNVLYKALGLGVERSVSEFYTKYIIPSFKIFTRESQIAYLTHIRDSVLPLLLSKSYQSEREAFLQFLVGSPCVPDQHGNLHHAREFYDPRNKVFQMMLEENSDQFPPHPFHEQNWLEFLSEIGLKTIVKENQFLEYCQDVASFAINSREDERNAKKSKVLVQYLFENEHLRGEKFLCSVSSIRFIASKKVQPGLLSLHKQYRCNTEGEQPPYIQFLGAIPWKYRVLVWTSAELLPSWGKPNEELIHYLGVQEIPSVDSIVTHLHNISCTLAEISKKDEALPQAEVLKDIMKSIYTSLDKERNCSNKEISDGCSQECRIIGNRLKNIPCVLVEDGKVLVKGNQLCFSTQYGHAYHPFLYTVPREYGSYEHLMKRLGATEQLTSLQLANVLKAIKNQCQDSKMNPNFFHKVCTAMGELFQCVFRESDRGKKASMISDLNELFLPSEDGFLIKSNVLVCKIPPRLRSTVANLNLRALFPMEKCDIRREQEDVYLNALPPELRPRAWNDLFNEVLDPSCLDDTCPLCQEDSPCEFIEKYILILQSTEFRQGIVRLLKHQKKSNELDEKEKERSSFFGSSKLKIKCMRNIKVHLVDAETEEALENSSRNRSCYVVEKDGSWTFFIQHDNGGRNNQAVRLSYCVQKILCWCLVDSSAIASMLLCDSPAQIPGELDNLDIAQDFAEEELKLGREVPVVFHYLMQQNPLFVFHEGEIVAYGVETTASQSDENEDANEETFSEESNAMKYVLARVITRTNTPTENGALYDFTAQYRIDLGSEQKIVSVLDLYKFYQNDFLENLTTDLVLYTGDTSTKPTSLDEAKREIQKVLREAWRLPHELRRKAIRRLYLRWHPDKNPNNAEFYTEIMQFLLSEVRRMEAEERGIAGSTDFGFDGLFRGWGHQARRDRETYQNFHSCHPGSRGPCFATSDYTSPNRAESHRWMKQAQRDLEAAEFLLSAPCRPFDALVCFVSQQTVEKGLKAALYAKCGLNDDQLHTHDVYKLANEVCRLRNAPDAIIDLAVVVGNYYLPTRYPNRLPGSIIPADAFNREQSEKAVQAARRLLEMVKAFITV